eukprot:g1904.t1
MSVVSKGAPKPHRRPELPLDAMIVRSLSAACILDLLREVDLELDAQYLSPASGLRLSRLEKMVTGLPARSLRKMLADPTTFGKNKNTSKGEEYRKRVQAALASASEKTRRLVQARRYSFLEKAEIKMEELRQKNANAASSLLSVELDEKSRISRKELEKLLSRRHGVGTTTFAGEADEEDELSRSVRLVPDLNSSEAGATSTSASFRKPTLAELRNWRSTSKLEQSSGRTLPGRLEVAHRRTYLERKFFLHDVTKKSTGEQVDQTDTAPSARSRFYGLRSKSEYDTCAAAVQSASAEAAEAADDVLGMIGKTNGQDQAAEGDAIPAEQGEKENGAGVLTVDSKERLCAWRDDDQMMDLQSAGTLLLQLKLLLAGVNAGVIAQEDRCNLVDEVEDLVKSYNTKQAINGKDAMTSAAASTTGATVPVVAQDEGEEEHFFSTGEEEEEEAGEHQEAAALFRTQLRALFDLWIFVDATGSVLPKAQRQQAIQDASLRLQPLHGGEGVKVSKLADPETFVRQEHERIRAEEEAEAARAAEEEEQARQKEKEEQEAVAEAEKKRKETDEAAAKAKAEADAAAKKGSKSSSSVEDSDLTSESEESSAL